MSNVVKLATKKKKKLEIDNWKAKVEELSHKLGERLYDQIILASGEAYDDGMPEEVADCMILGVLVNVLVYTAHARNILGPDVLLKLVADEIEEHEKDSDDA